MLYSFHFKKRSHLSRNSTNNLCSKTSLSNLHAKKLFILAGDDWIGSCLAPSSGADLGNYGNIGDVQRNRFDSFWIALPGSGFLSWFIVVAVVVVAALDVLGVLFDVVFGSGATVTHCFYLEKKILRRWCFIDKSNSATERILPFGRFRPLLNEIRVVSLSVVINKMQFFWSFHILNVFLWNNIIIFSIFFLSHFQVDVKSLANVNVFGAAKSKFLS